MKKYLIIIIGLSITLILITGCRSKSDTSVSATTSNIQKSPEGNSTIINFLRRGDSDNDYIPDNIELILGMDPHNPDEDDDGTIDGLQTSGNYGDTFFDKQWYIRSTGVKSGSAPSSTTVEGNDLHLLNLYHRYMGLHAGVVQLIDTGIDYTHEDLKDNLDLDLSRNAKQHYRSIGSPEERQNGSYHGTMCAGIIAARAFNGKGVRGIAPFVKLAGSNWIDSNQTTTELEEAWTRGDPDGKIILVSNSWGTPSVASPNTYFEDLMEYGAKYLRKIDGIARGKLFLKAAGNGRKNKHDACLVYESSNRYVITVASLKSDNTYASYSSPGSCILVSGYGGAGNILQLAAIATTYHTGGSAKPDNIAINRDGGCLLVRQSDNQCTMPTWENDDELNYTYGMNGTSAATPTVAGVLALVLEACPKLDWRDVKYLIAKHAIKVDPDNPSWVTNSAGLHHSVDYGFGLINGEGMVADCEKKYTPLPQSDTIEENFNIDSNISIPDNNLSGISYSFDVTKELIIEWMDVTITSDHSYGSDLEIYLTSPAGTTTRLMLGKNSARNYSLKRGFRYGSVAFMGESTAGTWTLRIADIFNGDEGSLQHVKFGAFGHHRERQ
ncbi:MAG: S8 family serine peptidase [Sulfurovum sp.]|nr:S8 family serine peptidase [Sulfurovum sp.]MCB4760166.1 S8 family serine peptidase [Sulfurovum sp.]